jgi:hypothetical protein
MKVGQSVVGVADIFEVSAVAVLRFSLTSSLFSESRTNMTPNLNAKLTKIPNIIEVYITQDATAVKQRPKLLLLLLRTVVLQQ